MAGQAEELPDLYELFDLANDATDKEIQRAFRRQAIKYHPDKNPSVAAAKQFHILTLGLDLLSDPERRRKYDAERASKREAELRREKMEGERREWIDALEKSEAAAARPGGLGTRRANVTREEEIAQQGAQLRAALKREIEQRRKKEAESAGPSVTRSKKRAVDKTEDKEEMTTGHSVLARFRGRATSAAELQTLFSKFGKVLEVIYRPSKPNKTQSALIEFARLEEAQEILKAPLELLSDRSALEFRQLNLAHETTNIASSHAATASKDSRPRERSTGERGEANRKAPKVFAPVESLSTSVIGSAYEKDILNRMHERQRERDIMAQQTVH